MELVAIGKYLIGVFILVLMTATGWKLQRRTSKKARADESTPLSAHTEL